MKCTCDYCVVDRTQSENPYRDNIVNDKEEHKKAVASALAESAATMEANYCELTLDVVDKIALRFAAVLIESRGSYVPSTQACSSEDIMSDAYAAADDFLKEKLKRDEFEIQAEYDEDTDEESDEDDDDELVAVVKQLGSGKVHHLVVNNVPVASIGSFCSSEEYRKKDTSYWSAEGLQKAAHDINEGVELQEQETEDRPPIAFVQTDCVGNYLVVSGTTVCRTGDRCKDPHFRNSGLTYWTTAALELVAEGINKEL